MLINPLYLEHNSPSITDLFILEVIYIITIIDSAMIDILTSIYHSAFLAIVLSFLGLFLYMQLKKQSFCDVMKTWISQFRGNTEFRKIFFLVFYSVIVINKTLVNTNMWINPLSDLLGGWSFYDKNGIFSVAWFSNFVLYIPLIVLLFWAKGDKLLCNNSFGIIVLKSFEISFAIACTIQVLRLFLRIGVVRIADFVYQIIGGVIGGIIFFVICKFKYR